ncbi:GDP-L-fucose synthase family protein [Tenacibaculum aiptasiae]|uniref:GDP-L-fucose synthase family protein n=1 Tax=Tenacibaculum aiptasiae TaxID=426481 RepID=UPI003B5B2CCC
MKILLTGASGMVGKNILEFSEVSKHQFLTPTSQELDLLDYNSVYNYIKDNQPEFIIHAAGKVGGIQANIAEPVSFLVDNIDMGRNIIIAAKNNGVKNLLNLGSSCMYPREAKNPLSEDLILKGELEPTNEGYAIAKVMSTRLCEYIMKEDKTKNYKTVIPCNLYGKHDKFSPKNSHMIPAVIRKIYDATLANQQEIDIWGDGLARREFMYAEDLADFIFYAIDKFDEMPQNINVGLGHDYTINEYYKEIAEVIGYKGQFVHDLTKPVGMKQKLIDDSKLIEFGWRYKTSLKEGVKKTFEYYKKEEFNEAV